LIRTLDYFIFGAIVLVVALLFWRHDSSETRTAFFYNQTVFEQFKGTLELNGKLNKTKQDDQHFLDSLLTMVQGGNLPSDRYEIALAEIKSKHEQLSNQYTADLWKFINEGVKEYGKVNEYDYIFGAAGNGSLMYAREGNDITPKIVEFLNARYDANPTE